MNLILIGAPASGKGTQANHLARHFSLKNLSTGDMLRRACAQGDELGIRANTYLREGQLVPDDLVVQLVLDRLEENDQGIIMDGFPRTLAQAEKFDILLEQRNMHLDGVILIKVSDPVLIKRSTDRRFDPETGRIYNLHFDPPPDEILARLEKREDDNEEIVKERLRIYKDQTTALITHYQKKNLLTPVEGSRMPEEVFFSILEQLNHGQRQTEQ